MLQTYEKLGVFYLGKRFDPEAARVTDDLLLYDAKDLTTHAVCVGMTGSGKTGLCVSLLEEAALDGIPAIALDPKGDLGNLLLTFPQLQARDFRPWIDESEAGRKGMSPDEYAADRARLWRSGLQDWGQDGGRIARLRSAADLAIYTPGSSAGMGLSVLRSLSAPPPSLLSDREGLGDRVSATVSGLLALLGIDADPIRSREHILLSNILLLNWQSGQALDIPGLVREIQSPSFSRVGVIDLESFFPARDRFTLAMTLNNLLASPTFATWLEGEPLEIGRLLYTPDGRPRVSIISIAHLSEAERMFVVTLILNEVVAWVRAQPGTSSLRALLYMDEVFGFFPPTANPPSKKPMLTLLKQARAYGLGVVLATQNPVDLDYKGLSNAGTWFLGRLQTERDKQRVLEGLEGASVAAGSAFDRGRMEAVLAGLRSRVFLMNNVHEDEPVLFHTRWAMSYLRGPLTRNQIQTLMASRRAVPAGHAVSGASVAQAPWPQPVAAAGATWPQPVGVAAGVPAAAARPEAPARPPALSPGVKQFFLPVNAPVSGAERLLYRPRLIGTGRMHFVRSSAKVDLWTDVAMLAPLAEDMADPWEEADDLAGAAPSLARRPEGRGRFTTLPPGASRERSYSKWSKAFIDHLYRNRALSVWKCSKLKAVSRPGETEGEFRIRLRQMLHERRDRDFEKLRKRYAPKFASIRDRIRRAEQRIEKEKSQLKQHGFQTAVSLGATLLGAMFGRKAMGVGTVGRATTTLRGAGRTARERGDIETAKENVAALGERLNDLEQEFEEDAARLREAADVDQLDLEEISIRPRKSDMSIKNVALVWAPYRVSSDGILEAAYEL
ncbi:MAG: ATP-binding protein [Planctomycetota bacterium]|jgi:hypothetical protein